MQGDLAWDDVRLFLALSRGRKLAVAAKSLALDASTLSRRLAALEERCGARLFERTRDGLVPTAAGLRLVAPAEETEGSVMRFFQQVRPVEQAVEGTVRITAPPGVIELMVIPAAAELMRRHPKLRLELDGSETVASLIQREADVAVRLRRPTGEGLLIRRVGASPYAIVASRELAASLGSLSSLDEAPWIAWDAQHAAAPSERWRAAHVKVAPLVRASTMLAQAAAVECSLGVALLPVLTAERRGLLRVRLSRKLTLPALPADDVFLVCHAALRDVPRIRAVWTFLLETLLRLDPAKANSNRVASQ